MGLFSFFKPTKPVGFTYNARFSDTKAGKLKYYNEDKDSFMERLREVREQAESDDPEDRKARIRRKLQRTNTLLADKKFRQQKVLRSNVVILLLIIGLIILSFAVLDIYLPQLMRYLGE